MSYAACRMPARCRAQIRPRCVIAVFALLLLVATSCVRKAAEENPVQSHLGWLGSMYGMYIAENQGKTPRSIDQFKQYIEKRATSEQLALLGVTNVDELFKSPRDGQQFGLAVYTKLPEREKDKPTPIVLYEQKGQDGRRAVAYLGGGTAVLDERELPQLLPAAPTRAR